METLSSYAFEIIIGTYEEFLVGYYFKEESQVFNYIIIIYINFVLTIFFNYQKLYIPIHRNQLKVFPYIHIKEVFDVLLLQIFTLLQEVMMKLFSCTIWLLAKQLAQLYNILVCIYGLFCKNVYSCFNFHYIKFFVQVQ